MSSSKVTILDDSSFPSAAYNLLPHIDAMGKSAKQFTVERARLLELIENEGLQNVFSVHLVHKHFDLPEGHIMVYETLKHKNLPDFQICSPRLPEGYANLHGLYFLAHDDKTMKAYEYTTDAVVDVQPHLDFISSFSAALIEMGMERTFALTVKRTNNKENLFEFEIPDLSSTVLVEDPSWLPEGDNTPTDWGVAPKVTENQRGIRQISNCTKTRSGSHHPVGMKCTQTRTGKHYKTGPKAGLAGNDGSPLTLDDKPIPVDSEAFAVISCALQAIQAAQ